MVLVNHLVDVAVLVLTAQHDDLGEGITLQDALSEGNVGLLNGGIVASLCRHTSPGGVYQYVGSEVGQQSAGFVFGDPSDGLVVGGSERVDAGGAMQAEQLVPFAQTLQGDVVA